MEMRIVRPERKRRSAFARVFPIDFSDFVSRVENALKKVKYVLIWSEASNQVSVV
jgi:hypothetical protein